MENQEIDELIKMLDSKMESGISRVSVGYTDRQEQGTVRERHFHGKVDAWEPWIWGEGYGERADGEERKERK